MKKIALQRTSNLRFKRPCLQHMSRHLSIAHSSQKLHCPVCQSDVYYRYGKSMQGKPRYYCLVCARQFVENSSWQTVTKRPDCARCGQPMHVYKREKYWVRFRCANYPSCRTFEKTRNPS